MKKIERWEDFDNLPENCKNAVSDYDLQQQLVSGYQHRLFAYSVPVGLMMIVPALFSDVFSGVAETGVQTTLALVVHLMWVSALLGIVLFALVAGVWTHALLKKRSQRKHIAYQHAIDVDGLDLMTLRMEYERRT